MKNLLILDIDGVLITAPTWKPDSLHTDNYAEFDSKCIQNLNTLLAQTKFELWLSSSRRSAKTLDEFNTIFKNRNIISSISGFIPYHSNRFDRFNEVDYFLNQQKNSNFLIIDDDTSLQLLEPLKKQFWVQTYPLIGFNDLKLNEALQKIKKWHL